MPQKTKKQHFVPQFLLRNFVNEGGKLWVYDKTSANVFASGTDGVACDRYFYDHEDITEATGQEQFVERSLAVAEARWSSTLTPVLDRVRGQHAVHLTPEERLTLSQMLAVQLMRTPLIREREDQITWTLLNVLKQHGATDEQLKKCNPRWPTNPSEWDSKGSHIESMVDNDTVEKYQSIFASHIWQFLRTNGFGSLYISDHPLARRPHVSGGWRSYSGIASRGIEITFPIAHDVVLVLLERSHFEPVAGSDGESEDMVSAENLLYYNSLQVKSSLRWLYCRTNDFSHAELVCSREPHLRDPGRKLVDIS